MTPINVVCGIIWKDERIFIARRKPHKSLGGYWEFPGGKTEQGEDLVSALERELLEELDMIIANPVYFGEHLHTYDALTVHLIAYSCDFISSSFTMTDHDACEFVSPVDLRKYQIAAADLHFIEQLQR